MSWSCCNPRGECQQGPGCPARVLFNKPAKPAARNGVPAVDLRRVQLAASPKRKPERHLVRDVLAGFCKGCIVVLAAWGLIFALALLGDYQSGGQPAAQKKAKVIT